MYEHFPSPVALFLLLDVIVANKNDDFLERVKEITLVKSQDSSSYDFNQALMLSHIQNGSLHEQHDLPYFLQQQTLCMSKFHQTMDTP